MCITSAWSETAWQADLVLPLSALPRTRERHRAARRADAGLPAAPALRRARGSTPGRTGRSSPAWPRGWSCAQLAFTRGGGHLGATSSRAPGSRLKDFERQAASRS
ncbi:MAG: hypothetical protein MZU95_02360 [Desulfomicrobium escambiense]|nr:hypothetical protein [Desulfomicrobium escambiense]